VFIIETSVRCPGILIVPGIFHSLNITAMAMLVESTRSRVDFANRLQCSRRVQEAAAPQRIIYLHWHMTSMHAIVPEFYVNIVDTYLEVAERSFQSIPKAQQKDIFKTKASVSRNPSCWCHNPFFRSSASEVSGAPPYIKVIYGSQWTQLLRKRSMLLPAPFQAIELACY
jgi:hypothetical protein